MSILTRILVVVTCILFATECTSVKRFKSASYRGETEGLVEMKLFGSELDRMAGPDAGKSIWDLSAGAQEEMIGILNDRYPDNEPFITMLDRQFLTREQSNMQDFTQFDLRMVFTIDKVTDPSLLGQKGIYSPADRIETLRFCLQLPQNSPLWFKGWNRYVTEYGEIEIAEMSFNRSFEMEAGFDGEFAEGTVRPMVSKEENQDVRSRFMKLNGSISDKSLEIKEEGSRELDLAGNVVVDVELAFDALAEKICIPVTGNGPGGDMEVSDFIFRNVRVPRMENIPDRISAQLELEYIYRHVEKGWKTFQEWDDRVGYYKGKELTEVVLFEKSDFVPEFYCIGIESGKSKQLIHAQLKGGAVFALRFMSLAEARLLHDWLVLQSAQSPDMESAITVGNYTLLFEGREFSGQQLSSGQEFKIMPAY